MNRHRLTPRDDQATVRAASEGRDPMLDLAGIVYIEWAQLHAHRWCYGLERPELAGAGRNGRVCAIARDGYSTAPLFRHTTSRKANQSLLEYVLTVPPAK